MATNDMDKAIEIRKKCSHFRILIIGRANAGKTTILKKICETTDDPRIFDPRGEEIDISLIEPSRERGLHNIENQMVFSSNPQFIFHDSRGFEAGGENELESVQQFIENRAKETNLAEQLHAIWYCLPADNARPLDYADEIFFKECGVGNVPVIAIITKFDALISTAFRDLRKIKNIKEARHEAPDLADKYLEEWYIQPLCAAKYKPKRHVRLSDLQKKDTNCSTLVEETAAAIDDDALKLLFVSVQQNNLDICVDLAVERGLWGALPTNDLPRLIRRVLVWFPHTWREWEYSSKLQQLPSKELKLFLRFEKVLEATVSATLAVLAPALITTDAGAVTNSLHVLSLAVATIVCTKHTFSNRDKMPLRECLQVALKRYQESNKLVAVRNALEQALSVTSFISLRDPGSVQLLLTIIRENSISDLEK